MHLTLNIPHAATALLMAATLVAVSAPKPSHAAGVTIAEHYTRTSAGETVFAPFTVLATATVGSYAGPVELEVSGTGFSLGPTINDAFYFDGGAATSGFYMLNIGYTGAPILGSQTGRAANNFITFIDDVGPVALGSRPAYAPDHMYRIVVDVPVANVGPVSFGVSDGNFGDNGGAFTVKVWQLRSGLSTGGNVPEPTSAVLVALGLAAVAVGRARRGSPTAGTRW
jgi:hypothetical protein